MLKRKRSLCSGSPWGCSICLQNIRQLLGLPILSAIQSFLQPVHNGFISGLSLAITLQVRQGRVLVPNAKVATKLTESFVVKLQPII